MTTIPAPRPKSTFAADDRAREALWARSLNLQDGNRTHTFPLTNFAGRCYPTLNDTLMQELLAILPSDRVLDIGGGDAPFSRADVVADAFPDSNAHRSGRSLQSPQGRQAFVQAFAENLPFADNAFDFAYCRMTLEHVVDPAEACREMMRVAKRGFIESPSPMAEYVGGHPTHRWIVSVENLPDAPPTLVLRRKPFRRAPFRYAFRPHWFQDDDFRFRWEWEFRNLACTQFAWEGEFAFRVEEDLDALDYDDPVQAAEAHLDAALCGLRFGGVPTGILLPDADLALSLRPNWPLAHNTRGCLLWLESRYDEAMAAFREAARHSPGHSGYAFNAAITSGSYGRIQPRLDLLPPTREDVEDIETNFAGKVYYAFVHFDARLAQDLNILPHEKVLDVGGGQRPFKRADVSADFDVFEGLHRQGYAISREKLLVCADAQKLPFRNKAFDVACCRMVLEHVLDPAAACRELQRVARRGFIETPNTFWECVYGHPTHRWLIEWEAPTRTLVFRRKPFDAMPFKCAMVPYLYQHRDVQRAFEITFRNITTTQVTWDEEHPFSVRVEDDPNCPYDYLNRPEDAARGSMNYARDLVNYGLAGIAGAEADDAIRHAPTQELYHDALRLRLHIAEALHDTAKTAELREKLKQPFSPPVQQEAPSEASRSDEGDTLHPTPYSLLPTAFPPVVWHAPLREPCGYADEARHFLFALDAIGAPVVARHSPWSDKVAELSQERAKTLHKLMRAPEPARAIQICHTLAPFFRRAPEALAMVGRTMFETDRLPDGWAAACNQMDAVWVPSAFNLETFAASGVIRSKLRIVPGTIDLAPYDPNCEPLRIDGARGFNFLSVFDWTLRKGWDALLRAFIEEFRAEENVALILKTHSGLGYTTLQISDMIVNYLVQALGRDPNTIPDIILQDANVPDSRMPNLYRAADCYVMPTRGEGWGRPLMEAMAMALPVIATGYSGQTAFMNAENSLLLDYELAEVPEVGWRETPTYRGHRWAEPSVPHLRQLMRRAFEDRAGGRELGLRARAHIETHFTYGPVAQILRTELERLA